MRTLGPPRLLKDPASWARGEEGNWRIRIMREQQQKCDKRRRRRRGHGIVEHTIQKWSQTERDYLDFLEIGEKWGDLNGIL